MSSNQDVSVKLLDVYSVGVRYKLNQLKIGIMHEDKPEALLVSLDPNKQHIVFLNAKSGIRPPDFKIRDGNVFVVKSFDDIKIVEYSDNLKGIFTVDKPLGDPCTCCLKGICDAV